MLFLVGKSKERNINVSGIWEYACGCFEPYVVNICLGGSIFGVGWVGHVVIVVCAHVQVASHSPSTTVENSFGLEV